MHYYKVFANTKICIHIKNIHTLKNKNLYHKLSYSNSYRIHFIGSLTYYSPNLIYSDNN